MLVDVVRLGPAAENKTEKQIKVWPLNISKSHTMKVTK